MEQRAYFAIIPANVRYDKRLNANAKLLYGEITALSNEKGYCWATNSYFAELYGVSTRSISEWIHKLVEFGYLNVTQIYKKGTKQIEQRRISIATSAENFHTHGRKLHDPIEENFNTPIEENFQDNSTLFNNTINNNTKSHSPIVAATDIAVIEKKPAKKEPKRSSHEKVLFTQIWQMTIGDNGIELIKTQSGREAKACWDLVDLSCKQFGDMAFDGASSIISSFMAKKRNDRSQSAYWRDKSPRPSTILSCWPQLLETLRVQTLTKEQQEAMDEIIF